MEWPVLGRSRARRSNDTLMAARQRQEDQKFNAGYEEAQSRLRMSMCCKSMAHPIQTPLQTRVVDLAQWNPVRKRSLPEDGPGPSKKPVVALNAVTNFPFIN